MLCLLGFQDVLTDLSADCETLTLEDVLENGLVHKVSCGGKSQMAFLG